MKEKVLVTGGAGYIGSHTVVELMAEGFEVVIVDNLSNSSGSSLEGIAKITGKRPAFYPLDLIYTDSLQRIAADHPDIRAVIHFAAFKAVGESVEKPLLYYKNNLLSLIHLLEYMSEKAVPSLVFSSSCTVYGQPETLPVNEETPIQAAFSPYGNTKQICEEIISDSLKAHQQLQAISLRYFNPIGAHETAFIGELPIGPPDNLVPYITQTAIGIRDQLRVFGNDYNTPDGTAIRDYLHVTDLALAHVTAVKRMLAKAQEKRYEVFNLGSGRGASVMEVIRAFEKASNQKLNYTLAPRRAGDIEQIWADPSKANQKLKWKTERDLETALASAWKWEQEYRKQEKARN